MGRTKRTTTMFYDLAQTKAFGPFIQNLGVVDRMVAKNLFSKGRKHMHSLSLASYPLQFQPMLLIFMLEQYKEILQLRQSLKRQRGD
jgi:hypothetical protein